MAQNIPNILKLFAILINWAFVEVHCTSQSDPGARMGFRMLPTKFGTMEWQVCITHVPGETTAKQGNSAGLAKVRVISKIL